MSTGNPHGPKVLNYRNAPDVLLWSAVIASCALPFTYKKCQIFTKHRSTGDVEPHKDGLSYVDGSIEADIPFEAIHDEFNVNHAVVAHLYILYKYLIIFINSLNNIIKQRENIIQQIQIIVLRILGLCFSTVRSIYNIYINV